MAWGGGGGKSGGQGGVVSLLFQTLLGYVNFLFFSTLNM